MGTDSNGNPEGPAWIPAKETRGSKLARLLGISVPDATTTDPQRPLGLAERPAPDDPGEPVKVIGVREVTGAIKDISAEKAIQLGQATERLGKRAKEAQEKYGPQVEALAQQSLTHMDAVADKLLARDSEGNPAYPALRTVLSIVGKPFNLTQDDIEGIIRGYQEARKGHPLIGLAKALTAIFPPLDTKFAHSVIDAFTQKQK